MAQKIRNAILEPSTQISQRPPGKIKQTQDTHDFSPVQKVFAKELPEGHHKSRIVLSRVQDVATPEFAGIYQSFRNVLHQETGRYSHRWIPQTTDVVFQILVHQVKAQSGHPRIMFQPVNIKHFVLTTIAGCKEIAKRRMECLNWNIDIRVIYPTEQTTQRSYEVCSGQTIFTPQL